VQRKPDPLQRRGGRYALGGQAIDDAGDLRRRVDLFLPTDLDHRSIFRRSCAIRQFMWEEDASRKRPLADPLPPDESLLVVARASGFGNFMECQLRQVMAPPITCLMATSSNEELAA
jgi:hypothetical protein